jgi:Flp pilus assembly protein CpaB
MRPTPRRRLRPALALRRQPRLWWPIVVLVALSLGAAVSSIVAGAERTRAAWGTTEVVAVATRTLDAGATVGPGDVDLVERPAAMVPAGAVRDVPAGEVAAADIAEGEVLVASRLAPSGLSGLAATLPAGTRAVAIPVEAGLAPPLEVGDHVDVLVALAPEAAGSGPPGFVVTPDALVVDVAEQAVTIAVPRAAAPEIAVALGAGAVTLALIGA